jgi:alpha-ketoglutarate-dependent taurine dioxygenase
MGHGALLFRGAAAGAQEFEQVCRAGTPQLLDYTAGGSPRTRVNGKIYTSTEYPREQPIPLHCEMTYLQEIPHYIWFWCERPAEDGGETPIGDMCRFLERLDDRLIDKFDRFGVRYIYNLHGGRGFGRGWKEAFGTDDREQVEIWLTGNASEFSWEADGSLHAELQGPGLRKHSVTGESIWGNQATSWHIGSLSGQMAQRMRRVFREDSRLPKHATFGDGSPIPDSDIRRILDGLADEELTFDWRRGDVLLCDNQRCAHGRRPFTGERRVLVALA